MTRDWKRLGDAIKARREELGIHTQQALADAAGVTRQSVQSLESGTERTRMPASIRPVEKALDWEPGTASRFLSPAQEGSQNGATPRFADGMPVRVVHELSSGEAVDTEVVDLFEPGSPYRLVAVFKQDAPAADLDPEELARAMRKWSRMQRALREIADDPSGSGERS
ncbi:helix-turn-helix transcriptional regulator [Streptomyces shenzhenensis]|uniref:helix-turn-helix transcriptional regulator n=1 Tax=Streptomyces shenzhenensis TaxID=943815 RepID=UPI0036AD59DA